MRNEEMINELKKDLVYNQYRDTYVIRGENLPFMAERLVKLFAIPVVVGQSEQLPPNPITGKEYKNLMKALYRKDNSKRFRR